MIFQTRSRTLFLIVVSILTLDIFRSVRFAHRHVISKISDTSLNASYYIQKLIGWSMNFGGM